MLNSYPAYNLHHVSSTANLRRNSLNSTLSLTKYRRNSFSPPTPLILASQPTFTAFQDNSFPSASTKTTTSNDHQIKVTQSTSNFFPESKDDPSLSFLDGLDLTNNLIPSSSSSSTITTTAATTPTVDDNLFTNKNIPTPPLVVPASPSTFQCVRIIRRSDSTPIPTNPTSSQRRVVRVIRLSNASRPLEQSTSNVYIVRKTDVTPTVHINPAVQHVIAKSNTVNNNSDENNQPNKFYGSTISIFGIEFTVVSNEANATDKCASLVQNMNDTTPKPNVQPANKINDIHKLFSRIYRCVLCAAEFDVYEDFVSHGSGHLQDLTLKPLETASVFRRRSYRCLLPHCNARIESETESPRILDQLFRRHLLSHVGTHPFKCHICKSKFQRIQNYRVHLAYHEEMNSPSLQCKKCLKKFTADKQYNFHIRKCFVVPPSSPQTTASFRCHICGENFEKDQSLNLHIKHIHSSRPSTPNVTAIRSDNEVRVRLVSPPVASTKPKSLPNTSNTCQICCQDFPKRLLYKKHMLTHLGDKHFACTYPGCKDTFYSQSNLDRHVRTVHLRGSQSFVCTFPHCGKTFARNDSLRNHRVKHFPNMIMKCPYVDCEEKFRVRSTYHAHVKRHRTEKQQASTIYVCVLQNCQYTTSNKASMKQHLTKVHDYKQEKDEDIPYIQYPSKQQQQTQVPPQPTPPQQQQILIDEPSTSSVVEVLAPIVVKLPGDEPPPPPQLAVPTPQPIVPPPPPPPPLNDPFDIFCMLPDVPLGDLDWLNIESEENIRPRKRQNIITISRDMESLSTVVVENLSGCARTDYRSNHALLERAKFRRKLLNYKRELLRVDSQPVSTSTRRLSSQLSDDNDDEDEDDILETTTCETSPKRIKRYVDINEN
ncbi:unnamed protein product [Adineta ricciae]|uniref:C2H2-type domain-containing protein n=1 Tax=Adineta ricciae TaxID=249248 RepID=A0A814MWL4_ADIRI|nr:unnamed protein product [Adineta ricciae]CAF1232032.1 unnamed protein product [Adineta ricciae]